MCSYHVSKFTRAVDCDGVVAVFNQLHISPMYIMPSSWVNLQTGSGKDELLNAAIDARVLVTTRGDASALAEYRAAMLRRFSRPSVLYLMLAQGCNNACVYCPIPELTRTHGDAFLSFENAIAGIHLWAEHLTNWGNDDEPLYIIFYGGEPLRNKVVFGRLVAYIAAEKAAGRLPQNVRMMLSTNGLLLNDEVARLAKKHEVLVALGVDGLPAHNDTLRVTESGEPTSTYIEAACAMLRSHGVAIAASVALTPANLKDVHETIAYLTSLGISVFGFNVLKGTTLASMLGTLSSEEYYRAAAQVVSGMYAYPHMDEYQFSKRVRALEEGLPYSIDCTCYGNQIVVQADGTVTNCPFLRVPQGNIQSMRTGFSLPRTDAVGTWRKRIPWLVEGGCTGESMTFLHSGGCAFGSYETAHNLNASDSGAELFNAEIMNELIKRRLPLAVREQLVSGELMYWHYRGNGTL